MKPIHRRPRNGLNYRTVLGVGEPPYIGSIKGATKKVGLIYPECQVILYDKSTLLPVMSAHSDSGGKYGFSGIPKNKVYFLAAFDKTQQFNAVIQDNVVPK